MEVTAIAKMRVKMKQTGEGEGGEIGEITGG